jgi:hypothetical protein
MTDIYSFDVAVEDVESLDTFDSALFYGPAGGGKTILAASAIACEGFDRVLIVDIEGSAKGVGRLYPGVKRIKASSFADLEAIKSEILANPSGLDIVIFDTLNAGAKLAVNHFKALPQNRTNKFGAWDDLALWVNDWMRSFHASPLPTIFTAHAMDVKNEQTGAVLTMPKMQGSAKEDVPTIPDIVGYLTFENVSDKLERVLYVGAAEALVTKNRFGLPDKITDPTMAKINQLIEDAK